MSNVEIIIIWEKGTESLEVPMKQLGLWNTMYEMNCNLAFSQKIDVLHENTFWALHFKVLNLVRGCYKKLFWLQQQTNSKEYGRNKTFQRHATIQQSPKEGERRKWVRLFSLASLLWLIISTIQKFWIKYHNSEKIQNPA